MRGQIDATHELITINTNMLQICGSSTRKGMRASSTWRRRNRSSRKSPPPCRRCLSNWPNNAICWRCCPADSPQDPAEKFELSSLQLPQELPVSLPSQLVEQRPDVRQAEENLHAASAQIGIAAPIACQTLL